MATAKYNWQEIKQNYLKSDIIEVKAFLITFLSLDQKTADGGYYKKVTKGWRTDKENMLKIAAQQATAENIEKSKQELLIPTELLLKGKQAIIKSIIGRVADQNKSLSMGELVTGLNAIKIELGEETVISKNKNTEQFLDKNGEPTDPPTSIDVL